MPNPVQSTTRNIAYIDAANLHKGVISLGWEMDYRRFRVWLRETNALSFWENWIFRMKTVLILGSTSDEPHAKKITDKLVEYGIPFEQHVASAHKEAAKALNILEQYKNEKVIYVTIACRSNELSCIVAGNSDKPTIACPPFADKIDLIVNINSTLQMPSNVPVMTILEPENVALAIKRIIELSK